MTKTGFLKGAVILTIAGVLVKIIGAVNKIFISRLLGGEGIGLYQMAYPIYYIATSLAIAGIPVAISIMVAEKLAKKDASGAQRVFKVSFVALALSGLIFGALLYASADLLIQYKIIYDPRAAMAIKALAPAIPFVTMLSCYRGYFQGFQDMLPTGVSQIGEQIIRVLTMFSFAYFLLSYGLSYAAAGAAFSTLPGAATALAILVYFYKRQGPLREQLAMEQSTTVQKEGIFQIVYRLFALAIPVSIANVLMPIMAGIDLVIVPRRLVEGGLSVHEATEAFGYLTGMANSLVNLPVIVTMALAAALVPAISSAKARGDEEEIHSRIHTSMKITYLFTIPAATGLFVLATPISSLLYATPHAGPPIAVLSFSIILLGLQQVTTGVLQGLGKTAIPMINLVISMVVKIALTWILTAISWLGINGAALATDVDFAIALVLNLVFIYYYTGYRIEWFDLFMIVLAASCMGAVSYFGYYALAPMIGNTLSIILLILIACIVYVGLLMGTGTMTRQEIFEFPFIGKKVRAYMEKKDRMQ